MVEEREKEGQQLGAKGDSEMKKNVKPRQRELSLLIKETECRFPTQKLVLFNLPSAFH